MGTLLKRKADPALFHAKSAARFRVGLLFCFWSVSRQPSVLKDDSDDATALNYEYYSSIIDCINFGSILQRFFDDALAYTVYRFSYLWHFAQPSRIYKMQPGGVLPQKRQSVFASHLGFFCRHAPPIKPLWLTSGILHHNRVPGTFLCRVKQVEHGACYAVVRA